MTFKSVKGVGAKTAQRLIVDLRDKVTAEDYALTTSGPADPMAQALQALVVLGYNRQASEKALQKVRQEQPDEEVEGLKKSAAKSIDQVGRSNFPWFHSFCLGIILIFSMSFAPGRELKRLPFRDAIAHWAPPDTNDPSQDLPYPFASDQSGGLFLKTPGSLDVLFDPVTGQYVVTRKIGDLIISPPMLMTPEEYRAFVFDEQMRNYWGSKTGSGPGSVDDGLGTTQKDADGRSDMKSLIPDINVNSRLFATIFGSNVIQITLRVRQN